MAVSALMLASCGPSATTNGNMNTLMMNANKAPTVLNSNSMPLNTGTSATMNSNTTMAAAGLTAAEVAKHNTETDCYAIVGDNVYNLTEWVNQHPGGPEAILGTCGKDLTAMKHPGGVPMTEQVKNVPQYKIGALAK